MCIILHEKSKWNYLILIFSLGQHSACKPLLNRLLCFAWVIWAAFNKQNVRERYPKIHVFQANVRERFAYWTRPSSPHEDCRTNKTIPKMPELEATTKPCVKLEQLSCQETKLTIFKFRKNVGKLWLAQDCVEIRDVCLCTSQAFWSSKIPTFTGWIHMKRG